MKKSRKRTQSVGSKPIEVEDTKQPFMDDRDLLEREAEMVQIDPNIALSIAEDSDTDAWDDMEERLDGVTSVTIMRNVAQIDAKAWLETSKALATEVKKVAINATSKKELFRIDARVDMFDRELKERKINIQPCRLHCQNALRDAYNRLS
jgi:hypothetical protein